MNTTRLYGVLGAASLLASLATVALAVDSRPPPLETAFRGPTAQSCAPAWAAPAARR